MMYAAPIGSEPDDSLIAHWPLYRPPREHELDRIAIIAGDPPHRLTPDEVLICMDIDSRA